MATVYDVAAYILEQRGAMSAMKVQKLVYYSQAWSLAWDGQPLFQEALEAWKDGPVSPALYAVHRGEFQLTSCTFAGGQPLPAKSRANVDAVLKCYGAESGDKLGDMTHAETPWTEARNGAPLGAFGNNAIGHEAMMLCYRSVADGPTRPTSEDVRKSHFRNAKEKVFRVHADLFQQLAG